MQSVVVIITKFYASKTYLSKDYFVMILAAMVNHLLVGTGKDKPALNLGPYLL